MLGLILTLVVIGVLLWAINTYLPMDPRIKNILNVVVIICVALYLLDAFGILEKILAPADIPIPRVR